MMMLISAVTTSVIINVTTILIATATPVESSSSDSLIVSNPPEQAKYVVISHALGDYIPYSAKTLMVEKSDEFDEWRAIRQIFHSSPFPVNTFPMKATTNSSKFCSSNFLTCLIRQVSSDFSTVKVLCYTVAKYIHMYICTFNIPRISKTMWSLVFKQ